MVLDCARRVSSGVRSNGIDAALKFIIIGGGELKCDLQKYAGELDIVDIVVLTSLNEGTPVSIIEAMAAARPVVATAVGGVKDVVQDGKRAGIW